MNDAELTKSIFGPMLNAFGGKAYEKVQYMKYEVPINVPQIEVCIRPRGAMPGDCYYDKDVTLTQVQTQRAYEILAEYHSTELELIADKLVKGEIE